MLAYNLSPSWNWDAWGFTDDQIRSFANELGKMGYVYNFITYGGHQTEALDERPLGAGAKEEGVLGFVRLIQRALRLANDPAQYPQSFVGGAWADRFRRAARGPSLTTSSMGGKSTETQHRKAVEVPTSVLERWLRIWTQHWSEQGLYRGGELSVELKERWAGSEDMMLNVFDEAHDKIAEIIFRVDKDREGRKFLAVKDQNTVKKYRSRRLMTLMHFFLLHRYKIDLVHYVTPTNDNRLSVQRMIQNGVFGQREPTIRILSAIEVDTARGQKIFANDESIRRFIARQFKPVEARAGHPARGQPRRLVPVPRIGVRRHRPWRMLSKPLGYASTSSSIVWCEMKSRRARASIPARSGLALARLSRPGAEKSPAFG